MQLIKYGHACVRIESDGGVLVIDPGVFSERAALDGVDAVLITHEHADHLDLGPLTDALASRPAARIVANAAVTGKLGDLAEITTTVGPGEQVEAAGLPVRTFGGWHAEIHPDIPRVPNVGYLVDGSLYHPGDSFDVPDGVEVDTLFVPISAPWLKSSESIDFIRAVAPKRAFALHDHLLSEAGFGLVDGLMSRLGGTTYQRLASGQAVPFRS
jgi:L-ascorbate metabolism protein UlaG (beta-lactamase superfamily)